MLLADPDLMRALTAPPFLVETFLALFDLCLAPPMALTLPLDYEPSLLKALAPFSCLKRASIEATTVCPSLKLYLALLATTPWLTYPLCFIPEMSGREDLAAEAAPVIALWVKAWMVVLTSASLKRLDGCLVRITLSEPFSNLKALATSLTSSPP